METNPINTKMKIYAGIVIVLMVLLGFIVSTIQTKYAMRISMHRMDCMNNLHGLCNLGVKDYHFRGKERDKLPFFGDKTSGEEYWSWRAVLRTRAEPDDESKFRLTEPWDSEYNLPLFKETKVAQYFSCPGDRPTDKATYVAVKGPGTLWTEMQNGNLPGELLDYPEMILIIETPEPKNFWAEPGDDVTPEEVIRLFEADPGLVKNSKPMRNYAHWPKNYVDASGEAKSFGTINSVKQLEELLTVSPEQIEKVKTKLLQNSISPLK